MFDNLVRHLRLETKMELRRQGHRASGDLINSVKVENNEEARGYSLDCSSLKYGDYVNRGRKPRLKPIPVSALIRWIEVKGLQYSGSLESFAYAIRAKIFQKGIPSNSRYGGIKFVDKVLKRNKDIIKKMITQEMGDSLKIEQQNFVKQINKK
jgi:hypothetical protein